MRDGPPPPSSPTGSVVSVEELNNDERGGRPITSMTSASTLLKEISTLRLKLHELEEDNKSSVAGDGSSGMGPTAATIAAAVTAAAAAASATKNNTNNISAPSHSAIMMPLSPEKDDVTTAGLRKDLAKLEQEKAEQEAEFMNQLSSLAMENQSIIADLKDKLARAESARAEIQLELESTDVVMSETEKWKRRMEDERRGHAEEVERLTANIKQADEEIAESKQEIDYLQQEAVELQSDKEEILEQAAAAKQDLENERRKSETYRLQLKESKEICTKLLEDVKQAKFDAKCAQAEVKQATESLTSLQHRNKVVEKVLEEAQMKTLTEEQTSLKLRAQVSNLDTELQKQRLENDKLHAQVQKLLDAQQLQNGSSHHGDADGHHQPNLLAELRAQVTELQANLIEAQKSSLDNNNSQQQTNLELELARTQNATLSAQVVELRTQQQASLDLERTNRHLQAQVSELQTGLRQEQKRIASHASKHALELEEARKTIAAQEQVNAQLGAQVVKLQADLQSRSSASHSSTNKELEEARRQLAAYERTNAQLQSRVSQLQADLKRDESLNLTAELDNVRSQLIVQERDNTRLREQVNNLRRELEDQQRVTRVETEKAAEKEIQDLQNQLSLQERSNNKLRAQLSDLKMEVQHKLATNNGVDDLSTTTEEKRELEVSVMRLEERLQQFQSKLVIKDKSIDDLTSSLKSERMASKSLLRSNSNNNNSSFDSEQYASAASIRELESLRKRNKSLSEEVVVLRKQQLETCYVPKKQLRCMTPERSSFRADAPHISIRSPTTSIKRTWPPSPFQTPTSKNDGVSAGGGTVAVNSPRTPVSGIVASFERRIHHDHRNHDVDDESTVMTMEARKELDLEREVVASLQRQLTRERKTVADLRAQLSTAIGSSSRSTASTMSCSVSPTSNRTKIERKLQESEQEVKRLQTLVDEMEREKRNSSREIERLRTELSYARDMAALQEEKKDDENKCEEIERLRTQVSALQPELEHAMGQIEHLHSEIDRLNEELEAKEGVLMSAGKRVQKLEEEAKAKGNTGQSRREQEAALNQLKVELTNTQLAKAELEKDYTNQVKELQTELEALETEAERELEEVHKELETIKKQLDEKNEEITRIEHEKAQLCSKMTNASSNRNDEFDELQSELMDMTTKTNAQAREVQTLKMRLEERSEREQQLQNHIGELESEIASAQNEARGNTNRGIQAARTQDEADRLRAENQQLRDSIRTVKMERRTLQERVESMANDKSSSKSVQVLRDRNNALKNEVEKLTMRLRKMEESITRYTI